MPVPTLPLDEKVRITGKLSRPIISTWVETIVTFLYHGVELIDSVYHRGVDVDKEIERRAGEGRYDEVRG